MFVDAIFFFILSIITSLFSIAHAAYNSPITFVNILGTAIFFIGVAAYSYYQGRKGNKSYTKFIIVYISVLILISIVATISKLKILTILLVLALTPMYTITHFIDGFLHPNLIVIIPLCIEGFLIVIAYYCGIYKRLNENK